MNENRKTAAVAPYSELANEFEALKSSLTPCGAAASERLTATFQALLADNHYVRTLAVSLYAESARRFLGFENDIERASDRFNVALRALGLTKCAAAGCSVAIKIAARNNAKCR